MLFDILLILLFVNLVYGISFLVPESVPIGHVIGYVEGRPTLSTHSKYFYVFPDTISEKLISIDDKSGEITLISRLNYEIHKKFEILAVPLDVGEGIQVTIEVEDVNDHAPTFPKDSFKLEISEFARIGAAYPLPRAEDPDGLNFTVKRYRIVQGNVNNVFKISTRSIHDELYAELVVNGQLDREYRDKYDLIVEASDGGKPTKIGRLLVYVVILDANDNAPIFAQPRYSISVPANLTIGSQILLLKATDGDAGDNGKVRFRLQKTTSERKSFFSLSQNGLLSSAVRLLPGTVHDLVVVAYDGGVPSLETTAIVTVTVLGHSLTPPPIDIIWLTDTGTAYFLENITLGTIVARLSLSDEQKNSVITLTGCPSLCLRETQTSSTYLLLVCGIFDREVSSEYHLKFSLRKGTELVLEHPVVLSVGDINDNAPVWPQIYAHITINRSTSVDDQTAVLVANDADQGLNGRVRYAVLDSDVVTIDPDTGRLTVLKELDCSLGSEIRFRVRATDNGVPSLFSDLQVTADLDDSYGRPPQFEKSLYEIKIPEDSYVGTCLLRVKASNSLCGSSSRIRYLIEDGSNDERMFNIESTTGTICLEKKLDFEKNRSHQLIIAAIDQNGSSGTCLVSIQVQDVNDNIPVFNPTSYNITVRERYRPSEPLVVVSATDKDEGIFGKIQFYIDTGNSSLFYVNGNSGELFLKERVLKGVHEITIKAKDGGGSVSDESARVFVYVIDSYTIVPLFNQSKYIIRTPEDILPGISIGSVMATGPGAVRYSIYSGDIDNQFMIHPETGRITVVRYLDADKRDRVVLNVQAELLNGGTNQTQVIILIEDHNDNSPKFPIDTLEITVNENQSIHEPFYIVHATDKDKKKNGAIVYSLISSHPPCPVAVRPTTGQLHLTEPLDFENTKTYRIRIKAQDQGVPPRSANMTLIIHVTDFNDNPPVFEKPFYEAEVVENCALMTTVLQVKSKDADSRENGKVFYRITNGSSAFGIDEKSGMIYTNENIDRETQNTYELTVTAQDQGKPPLSSSVVIRVFVLDVNDNAPVCASGTMKMVVPRDSALSTTVGTVVVADPDNGINGTVVYRSQQSNALFFVKSNGDVLLRRPLKESDPDDVRISIIASDQGSPRKSTVCYVQVKIASGTSAVKLVEPFERNIRVPNDCQTSCQLEELNITGVAKWHIQSNDVSNHFMIVKRKLYMTSRPRLPSPWVLSLILSDRHERQKHVTIRIVESNSIMPTKPIKLSPLLPIGSKVTSLASKSKPSDDTFYYVPINQSSLFELDESNGDVYLIKKIRHLIGQQINMSYKEIDGRTFKTEEKMINFEVESGFIDVPYFDREILYITVSETVAFATVITTVNATTQFASPLYRFLEISNQFAIDQYSGEVSVIENLHWNEAPYHLVVLASLGEVKSRVLLVVHVEDVNDNHPKILSSNEVTVFTGNSHIIHYVVATDDDYGSNATIGYEIISDPSNCFDIDPNSGALSMLRRPSSTESTIVVRASDNGSPSLFVDQTLKIRLPHVTHNWKYFAEDELVVELTDATPVGTVIRTIGLDGEATVQLSPSSSDFGIDDSGRITLLTSLIPGSYHLSVVAKTPAGNIDFLSMVIRVTSSKTAEPRISSASCGSITVPENRSLENFKQIVALNTSKNSRFSIQGSNKYFNIDPLSGRLSSVALDREQQSEHLLVINVTDGYMTDSCSVQITVSDVNDNAPQFSTSTPEMIAINDSVRLGDVVYRFTASDADIGSNARILFELVEDSSNIFDLDPESGELFIMRELSDTKKDWMVRVKVYDKGRPSLGVDRLLRIQNSRSVVDKTDIVPSFLRQKYVTSVDEGLTPGKIVSKVSLSSRDSRITYSIVEGNTDSAFEIDDDGVVRTAQELDYEIKESYNLKIIATGASPHQIHTRMFIDVNNVNDNPPVFRPQSKRKVLETLPIGSYITTVTANDADNLSAIEYSLDTNEKRFVIDRFTGVVHLAANLDYETLQEIKVDVMANDGNFTAVTSFIVVVMDVNDNAPEFQQRSVSIEIPHYTAMNNLIAKLFAFDRDSGENGRVSYSLADDYGIFHLDSNDGTLTMSSSVLSDSEFLLTVTASDHGFPMMSSVIPVHIKITQNELQQRPEFAHSSYEFSVTESMVRHVVFGNVSVDDINPYFYRIMDPIMSEIFDIDRLGRFTLKKTLDKETQELYSFTIDVGSQPLIYNENSTASVTIRVLDVNDNAPLFHDDGNPVIISDTLRHGDVLRILKATDADAGENGRVSYRIVSGDDYNIFTIDSDNGVLMFNQWNDEQLIRHIDGKWTVYVEARDHGTNQKASILALNIVIELKSWSGTAPFFVVPSYKVVVPENSSPDESTIFTAKATNRIGLPLNTVRYQLKDNDKIFAIHSTNGSIRLRHKLDYETKASYKMLLIASDGNLRSSIVSLEIIVLPVDEFPPVFTQSRYTFQITSKTAPGTIIGEVHAIDADGGIHGIPTYRIEPPNHLVTVGRNTGLISLTSRPETQRNRTIERIMVIASSSYTQQSSATVYIEISDFWLREEYMSFSSNIFTIGVVVMVVLTMLLVCLLGCCLINYRLSKPKEVDSPNKQIYTVSRYRTSTFANNNVQHLACSTVQDLPSNILEKSSSTTSSALSNSVQRNSLTYHRDVTSTRSQPDSGIDQDAVSVNSSITEYLVSIGLNPNPKFSKQRLQKPDTIDSALSEYIYAQLDEIPPSEPHKVSENVHRPEELYPPPLTAPTFRPLSEIFDELEEMQRERPMEREYVQVEI